MTAGRRLSGKVCVVNGVASEIGSAVARRLSDEGAVVVGTDRVEHSTGHTSLTVDLLDESQVIAMYEEIVGGHGHLDVIYNNVGVMDFDDRAVMDTGLDAWHRVVDGNLTVVFLLCKHGIPHVLNTASGGGSVINAASFLGTMGAATAQMAFSAAKAGVVQLTRDLGVHLARSGVRVNAVLFGPIDTATQRAVLDFNPDALEKRMVHRPMGRFGSLDEAAATIAFLASDEAGFITASAIPVDGGITEAFTVPERPSP
jgi:NAD(P)-dependent dehydrogenase (short-subunit alcohol dehydrogenase family)